MSDRLRNHLGHAVEIVSYPDAACLECRDCQSIVTEEKDRKARAAPVERYADRDTSTMTERGMRAYWKGRALYDDARFLLACFERDGPPFDGLAARCAALVCDLERDGPKHEHKAERAYLLERWRVRTSMLARETACAARSWRSVTCTTAPHL